MGEANRAVGHAGFLVGTARASPPVPAEPLSLPSQAGLGWSPSAGAPRGPHPGRTAPDLSAPGVWVSADCGEPLCRAPTPSGSSVFSGKRKGVSPHHEAGFPDPPARSRGGRGFARNGRPSALPAAGPQATLAGLSPHEVGRSTRAGLPGPGAQASREVAVAEESGLSWWPGEPSLRRVVAAQLCHPKGGLV